MLKNRIFTLLLAVFLLAGCGKNDLVIDTGETTALLEPSVSIGTMTVKETETETEPPAESTTEAMTTAPETAAESSPTAESPAYILNTSSKKIHLPTCSSVKKMKDENKKETDKTLEELLAEGYTACGVCKPDQAK